MLPSFSIFGVCAAAAVPRQTGSAPTPDNPDAISILLSVVGDLISIPNLLEYIPEYTDFSNSATYPFIGPVPNGPAPTGCVNYEVLIARGTGELGPFGFIVGETLCGRHPESLPQARGYAIQYPADAGTESWEIAVTQTVSRLNDQNKACPNQKFAVAGFSQGAMAMHLVSMTQMTQSAIELSVKVIGGAIFGDPAAYPVGKGGTLPFSAGIPEITLNKFPNGLNANVKLNCAIGDPVFTPATSDIVKHLTYR